MIVLTQKCDGFFSNRCFVGEDMDKEEFLRNIQEEDNNSLRTGAANRILQLLERQRYSNNEDSVKRWIWELCQNAKDVCNDSGKVKICIDLDESNQRVIFKHNGRAFSLANVMSLINQSSSKDRNTFRYSFSAISISNPWISFKYNLLFSNSM